MSDSSANRLSNYINITVHRATSIVLSINDLNCSDINRVRGRFSDRDIHFEESLAFMIAIGAVINDNGKLTVQEGIVADPPMFCQQILQLICARATSYRKELFEFLRKFKVERGVPVLLPPDVSPGNESDVRNFAIETGIVTHDRASNCYRITSKGIGAYAEALGSRLPPMSPELFASRCRAKAALGLNAELQTLAYEKARVGARHQHLVNHIALDNVAAGFDIQSVTVSQNETFPRYIEVKAVSPGSYAFYWSYNEVAVAKTLGEWYYLYLLPVKENGGFELTGLRMICNPVSTVLETQDEWGIEQGVVMCYRRESLRDAT